MTDTTTTTPAVTVDRAYRTGIRVRILQPTNTSGTRFRVWRADGTYADDPDRITVGYNHAHDSADNAAHAVLHYLNNKPEEYADSWQGRWVLADAGGRDWLAVRVPTEPAACLHGDYHRAGACPEANAEENAR